MKYFGQLMRPLFDKLVVLRNITDTSLDFQKADLMFLNSKF